MSKYRKWSIEEKLSILKEAEKEGVTPTIRKYGIYYATYYSWKEKLNLEGVEGLKVRYKRVDPEIKALQLENQRLKQIIAEKELNLQIKEELLKKTNQRK
ncbi:MAG: transposase [Saprospiraceae bacterium]|nr:transposase [Saprospiraceae bacterium]